MIKSVLITIFWFITILQVDAQIPGVYKYYIPHKNKSLTNNLYRKGVLPKDAFPNKIIELDNKQFLVVQKSPKSDVRAFKILEERQDFYILCSEDVDICDCRSSSFIYYKPNYKLQRIQKAFSFSLKRNLVARLHQFNIPIPSNYEDLQFCKILKQLKYAEHLLYSSIARSSAGYGLSMDAIQNISGRMLLRCENLTGLGRTTEKEQ